MRSLNLKSTRSSSNLFSIWEKPTSLFILLGIGFLFFDLQYLIMTKLPGSDGLMCIMGIHKNPANIAFAALLSLLFAWFVVGFSELVKKKVFSLGTLSITSISALLGTLTIFCPACTFPLLSLFGFSIGFSVFTSYNTLFKITSLFFMSLSLYYLNQQLLENCRNCKKMKCVF